MRNKSRSTPVSSSPGDSCWKTLGLVFGAVAYLCSFSSDVHSQPLILQSGSSVFCAEDKLGEKGKTFHPLGNASVLMDHAPDISPRLPTRESVATRLSHVVMPAIKVQLSTPRDYLFGLRDDYAEIGHAAEYSEYGFELSGKNLQALELRNTENLHSLAKPVNELYGLELSLSHLLFDQSVESSPVNFGKAELSYGLQYQQYYSGFYWLGIGGFLGRTEMSTDSISDILGPHISLDWKREYLGCLFQFSSSLMLGFNYLEVAQRGSVGSPLMPVGVNRRLASAEPHTTFSSFSEVNNSTLTELGASVSYPLSKNMSFQMGYMGISFTEFHRAWDVQVWELPNLGVTPRSSGGLWDDQFYATLEWRR